MNGIKMSDCRFYIDEEARTVVCVIPNTRDMVEDFIMDHFSFPEMEISAYSRLRKAIRMPYSFMGKAVCAEGDEWNEELGRLLAFSRAKDKCYKSFFKRANMYIQAIDRRLGDMINVFNDFGVKLGEKKDVLEQKIDELISKTEE